MLAELARHTDRPVFVHGMMLPMIEAYRERGRRPAAGEIRHRATARHVVRRRAGPRAALGARHAMDAPARYHSDAFASGLMRVRGVRRQRAFDRGFVLSDHADWPALLQTIEETGAGRVLATHGHAEPLARFCASRDARRRHPDGVGRGATGTDDVGATRARNSRQVVTRERVTKLCGSTSDDPWESELELGIAVMQQIRRPLRRHRLARPRPTPRSRRWRGTSARRRRPMPRGRCSS